MPTLSIKNVPDEVLDKLRARAARHHRSIQGELMAVLSAALESPASAAEPLGNSKPRMPRMRLVRVGGASRDRTDDLKLAKLALSQLS